MSICMIYRGMSRRNICRAELALISESHDIFFLAFIIVQLWFSKKGFSCLHVSFHTVRSLWSLHYLFHPAWDQKDRPSQARLQSASAWAQEHHCSGLSLQSQPALLDRRGGGQDLQGKALRHWRYMLSPTAKVKYFTVQILCTVLNRKKWMWFPSLFYESEMCFL